MSALAASFRDPSGFVFERDGALRRLVNVVYRPDYDHLIRSGLYDALAGEGLLAPHEEVDDPAGAQEDVYKVLAPERVPFVSYPYEWCFGQLKAAALATLEIQDRAMDHGMSLRDASAYNVQWLHGRPTLIDTLSFERLREGAPWIAYRQFCQHFLAPLALMSMVDVRLGQLMRVHLDGIPLDLASGLLPRRSQLRAGLQIHVHAHARSQQRHAAAHKKPEDVKRGFSERGFRGLVDSLRNAVAGLECNGDSSHWVAYYEGDSYTEHAQRHKEELVRSYLAGASYEVVWDLGANTGRFSRIAADIGAFTVSFDADPAAVEANYREARRAGDTNVLPLVMDLTNPSPAVGWGNEERSSLADRGPADAALALALVHHLAIGNNVPLELLARGLARLCEVLVIEFVPKEDAKVQHLLGSREDIFADYHRGRFERAFGSHFEIERCDAIDDSCRTLYRMRRA